MGNKSFQDNTYLLLRNGYIADGTGKKGFTGSVLINGGMIELVTEKEVQIDCQVINCTGKVIAPGFIDFHSHNDWYLPAKDPYQFTSPFTAQGITTFITGNCGFSPFGLKKNTLFKDKVQDNLFKSAGLDLGWSSMDEYSNILKDKGMTNNIACLVGHGTSRTSIRGYDPSPLSSQEIKELLYLLEEAMDQGAKGVSLGLQYEPGIFSTMDELKEVAKLVKSKDKILTVHAKASSALSGTYPLKPFGKPHNMLAVEDMIKLAKETGVKLQFSHLIFVGAKTWKTLEDTLKLFDRAIADGVDIRFDTYSYSCGASVISVVLPEWFMAKVPGSYTNKRDLIRLRCELTLIKSLLGFGYSDIQIAYAANPELNKYNGRFLSEIAKELKKSEFETYVEFAKRSNGKARVMQYRYSNPEIVEALMKHPASIFMTDSWMENQGTQNPSSFGCFPRFLQIARERKVLSLEETVNKMTMAAAERIGIHDRGRLQDGMAADITVFDFNKVRDNTNQYETNKPPAGIEHVFINGIHVLKDGAITEKRYPGVML